MFKGCMRMNAYIASLLNLGGKRNTLLKCMKANIIHVKSTSEVPQKWIVIGLQYGKSSRKVTKPDNNPSSKINYTH